MPTSLLAQWPAILRMAASVKPRHVLDVGPGWGKAGVLLREYVPSVQVISALEAHGHYIVEHKLSKLYDVVHQGRFEEVNETWLAKFDLVLMIDVIEHIEIGLAIPALRRIRQHLLVCTPNEFSQDWEPGLPETERHLSAWLPWMVWDAGFDCLDLVDQYAGWVGLFKRKAE